MKTDNIKLNSDLKIMRNDHSELLHAVFSLEKKVDLLHKENNALKEAQINSAAVAAQAVAAAANQPRRVQISQMDVNLPLRPPSEAKSGSETRKQSQHDEGGYATFRDEQKQQRMGSYERVPHMLRKDDLSAPRSEARERSSSYKRNRGGEGEVLVKYFNRDSSQKDFGSIGAIGASISRGGSLGGGLAADSPIRPLKPLSGVGRVESSGEGRPAKGKHA